MPRYFPDCPPDPSKSRAESRFYQILRGLPADWYVLHSVYVHKHAYKRSAEADFLIISPKALLVVEVKGGQVSRQNGEWKYTRQDGQFSVKQESPYQQAESAWHAIHARFKDSPRAKQLLNKIGIGWGCFVPDCQLNGAGPLDWPQEMMCDDERLSRESAFDAVQKMLQYAYEKDTQLAAAKAKANPLGLSSAEMAELAEIIRPSFATIPSMFDATQHHETLTWNLTVDQADAIWAAEGIERLLVHGPAGTGKTTIANLRFKSVLMEVSTPSVAFVCFNLALGDHLRVENLSSLASDGVFVGNLHSLLRDYSERLKADPADHAGCLRDLQAWATSNPDGKFDFVVIDEGQDLRVMPQLCEALGCLVRKGWAGGRWVWFEDRSQSVLNSSAEVFNPPSQLSYRLSRNVRNGRLIAEFANNFTENKAVPMDIPGHAIATRRHASGEPVSRLAEVASRVEELLRSGFKEQHIVLLDYSGNNESLSAARQIAGIGVAPWSTQPRGKTIRYSTVRKFKGLEAPAVIIYNIKGSIGNPDPLFYVATTRAKANLTLIGDMDSIISISETMGV